MYKQTIEAKILLQCEFAYYCKQLQTSFKQIAMNCLLHVGEMGCFHIVLYLNYIFRNDSIDAYLDDTPILEYARQTMDSKCILRLVGQGFGEDGYGIGLPKGSWLKV